MERGKLNKVRKCEALSRFSPVSLLPYGLQPARPLCPRDFPGKNTGVGCCFLPQNKRKTGPNLVPRTEAAGIKGGDGF